MGYTSLLFVVLISLTIRLSHSSDCDDTFGKPWQPSWIAKPRDDLRCKLTSHCKKESTQIKSEEFDKCCACRSCAVWKGSEIQLFIEYVSVLGKSLLFPDQASNDTEVYEIKHTDGEMTAIPSNLCNWDNDTSLIMMYSREFDKVKKIWGNIVKINFKNNKIRALTNLSCLKKLDELNLNDNLLTYVSNKSFTSLTHLRTIRFSGNLIQKIDPGILSAVPLNLFKADFSRNKLSKLDVSNMISLYPFCSINFETNKITKLVNEANFTLNMTNNYGPGFVDFKDNTLETFPDFKELLHLDDITQIGKLLSSGFDFRDIPLICDCHLEPFMSLSGEVLATLWHDYMAVKCAGPPDLKGMIISSVDPTRLICKLSANSSCQTPECNCFDMPKNNTMHVNCSKEGKANVLKVLPTFPKSKFSQFISVDISGHEISDISNITQLSSITMLNASDNNILEISQDVASALENATVDISNNLNLRHLPQSFQYCNVCNMYMSNLEIDCDCDSLWIETWLHPRKCINKDQMFFCRLPNGDIKSALDFKSSDIDCSNYKYPAHIVAGLIILIIFIIAASVLVFTFRYDLLIVSVRLKQQDRSKVQSKYSHDVFLSFNDADENVTEWVNDMLKDQLLDNGYRVFQATHDVTIGAERNSEVLQAISKTCNFLLVLSDSYLNQDNDDMRPWTENEWKYGWHHFLRDKYKNLIIVNFDHISSFDVDQPQIKAFLRVGCTIDFKNHNRNIMKAICNKLGKPYKPSINDVKGFENKKPSPLNISSFTSMTNVIQPLQDTDQDKNKRSRKIEENSQMVEGILGQPNCRFQCYYEDLSLKKTPHIPIINKIPSRQSKLQNPFNIGKLNKLSDIYNRHVSRAKSPQCILQRTKCKERDTDTDSSIQEIATCEKRDIDTTVDTIPYISKCRSSIPKHQEEAIPDSTKVGPNHIRNDVMDTFYGNNDTFQLDMSMTNSERSLSSVSNNDNSESDTRSIGESSNTYTTSIGNSTVSIKSDTNSNNSLTEISHA